VLQKRMFLRKHDQFCQVRCLDQTRAHRTAEFHHFSSKASYLLPVAIGIDRGLRVIKLVPKSSSPSM
jgi:hypothetical protein